MAKSKVKKLELTKMPMPPGVPERWRKMYSGSIYYFRGDYHAALKQWLEKKEEIERAEKETWRIDFDKFINSLPDTGHAVRRQLLFPLNDN
jgi:hypothetical protein